MPDHRPMAILWDLDGTLVDTVPFILAAVRHAFDGYGSCPTDAEWIAGIGTPLRSQLAALARRPEDVEHLLARYRAFWLAEHDRLTRAFPGAVETVQALAERGHPMAVVTAKIEEGAYRTLRHVGLAHLMGAVVGADSCARAKPHPEPVLLALERLRVEPGRAIFVGDSPHDLAAGRAAGVVTAAALWGACSADVLAAERPDHVVRDVRELVALADRGAPARPSRPTFSPPPRGRPG